MLGLSLLRLHELITALVQYKLLFLINNLGIPAPGVERIDLANVINRSSILSSSAFIRLEIVPSITKYFILADIF